MPPPIHGPPPVHPCRATLVALLPEDGERGGRHERHPLLELARRYTFTSGGRSILHHTHEEAVPTQVVREFRMEGGGEEVPLPDPHHDVLAPRASAFLRCEHVSREDFYALTPAEAKALMDASAAKRAKEERFLTQVYAAKPAEEQWGPLGERVQRTP